MCDHQHQLHFYYLYHYIHNFVLAGHISVVVYHSHPEYFTHFFIITQIYVVSITHLDCGSLAFAFNPVCIILTHFFTLKFWFIMNFTLLKMYVQ